jgi:4-hydroxy-4-methyl-2-oxoglutarate aldolase
MIDEAPRLSSQPFKRLADEDIAPFKTVQTAQLVDALGGTGALAYNIKPLFADQSAMCGTAFTVDAGAADNLGVLAAMDESEPGDILMVTTREHMDCAVVGDLVMAICANLNIAGLVTDGAVRDSRGIRDAGLPCFAAGISPNSPAKNGPASLGQSIVIGGVTVCSGDLIVSDEDGVVVVAAARVKETAVALERVLTAEADVLAQVRNGRKSMLKPG